MNATQFEQQEKARNVQDRKDSKKFAIILVLILIVTAVAFYTQGASDKLHLEDAISKQAATLKK
jgi:hypothetical protein